MLYEVITSTPICVTAFLFCDNAVILLRILSLLDSLTLSGLPDDDLAVEGLGRTGYFFAREPLNEQVGRDFSHFFDRLSRSRQARPRVRRNMRIVEPNDGELPRYFKTPFSSSYNFV